MNHQHFPGKIIAIHHEYDEPGWKWDVNEFGTRKKVDTVDRNIDAWWAVMKPESTWWTEGEEPRSFGPRAYTLLGGECSINIYDKEGLAGLRKLLDAIEADMDGGDA
jgi:hypothetical protein